jgi:hypothetical protein
MDVGGVFVPPGGFQHGKVGLIASLKRIESFAMSSLNKAIMMATFYTAKISQSVGVR